MSGVQHGGLRRFPFSTAVAEVCRSGQAHRHPACNRSAAPLGLMETPRFTNGTDFFEMAIAVEEDRFLPSYEDGRATAAVRSDEFSGRSHCWISNSELHEFCRGLIALENVRNGSTKLTSMSPGELSIRIFSVSPLGHMAIQGTVGQHVFAAQGGFPHSISFGFEFDPSQLAAVVRLGWVRRYGV